MARNDETEVSTSEELKDIETLKQNLRIATSIHEAIKAANGWRDGKAVTMEEYTKAVNNFLKAPIKGGN